MNQDPREYYGVCRQCHQKRGCIRGYCGDCRTKYAEQVRDELLDIYGKDAFAQAIQRDEWREPPAAPGAGGAGRVAG